MTEPGLDAVGPTTHARKRAFRDKLVPGTIENALKLSIYRDLWRGAGAESCVTADDLARLPLIDKKTYLARLSEFDHPDFADADLFENHTSGTTSRAPMTRFRSRDEVDFITRFFGRVQEAKATGVESTGAPPLLVSTINSRRMHGDAIGLPLKARSISVPFDGSKERLEELIRGLVSPEAVTGIAGDVPALLDVAAPELRLLTSALAGRGIDPGTLGVQKVVIAGDYLSGPTFAVLQKLWSPAALINRYSMSEVFGGAALCDECGLFHLDAFVYGEVVDIDTEEVVTEGTGVLVLSELFPFVRSHPLIRYWTADLVDVVSGRCSTGQPGLRYLGRAPASGDASHDEHRFTDWKGTHDFLPLDSVDGSATALVSVVKGKARVLVRPALVVDFLHTVPGVARHPLMDGSEAAVPEMGAPKWGLRWHNVDAARHVEAFVAVEDRAAHGAAAATALHERLLADNPELAELCGDGEVSLTVAAVDPDGRA